MLPGAQYIVNNIDPIVVSITYCYYGNSLVETACGSHDMQGPRGNPGTPGSKGDRGTKVRW